MQVDIVNDVPADRYEITEEVLDANPPRFGLNLESSPALPWYGTRLVNQWNVMSSMEPWQAHQVHTFGPECKTDGARITDGWNSPVVTGKKFWHGGLGWYDCVPVGLFDGGDAVIYRNQNGYIEKIHTAKVTHYSSQPAGEEYVELDPPLEGAIQPNDIIVFEREFTAWPSQESVTNLNMFNRLEPKRYAGFGPERNSRVEMEFDSENPCPEGGSTASLKVSLPGGSGKGIYQWFLKNEVFNQRPPDGMGRGVSP